MQAKHAPSSSRAVLALPVSQAKCSAARPCASRASTSLSDERGWGLLEISLRRQRRPINQGQTGFDDIAPFSLVPVLVLEEQPDDLVIAKQARPHKEDEAAAHVPLVLLMVPSPEAAVALLLVLLLLVATR